MFASGMQAWNVWGDAMRSLYDRPEGRNGNAAGPLGTPANGHSESPAASDASPLGANPWFALAAAYQEYLLDSAQRTVLFWDVLRQRANNAIEHSEGGKPPLLKFEYETVIDGRTLPRPVNYALLRIVPPAGVTIDPARRPYIVIDPRAGHGPGIGGFKEDSEIGEALRAGHPVYFVTFFSEPMPGQLLADIVRAEAQFVQTVHELHPRSEKPAIIGNCQAGWATAILAAAVPAQCGPIVLAGAPLSYWAGKKGENPMRYNGGLYGGSWLALMAADLGNGQYDGAFIVENFEKLNPSNTYWTKYYNLYSKVDTEGPRFLEFERWWNGFFLMNRDEFGVIVEELFIGNKLSKGELTSRDSSVRIDMRNIKSPIVIFCSWGDNITPPQQALNWILDLYASVDEIKANEQTIVYNVHQNIGHLGIFVSAKVAKKEHAEIFENLELIEMLPPGLYEMEIVPRDPDAAGNENVVGAFETTFYARTLDDIRAFDDGRADEQPFEVVERVSRINAALYEAYLAPAVRAVSNETTAKALRDMQPSRLRRMVWSDERNPMMTPIARWAEQVRRDRRPVSADNPFLASEARFSEMMVKQLDAYRDLRDRWVEQWFTAVYGQPWLRAAVGLAPADPSLAERPRSPQMSAARTELHDLRKQAVLARAAQGSALDAFTRALLYIRDDQGPIGERGYRALLQDAHETPEVNISSTHDFRRAIHDQYALLQLDPDRAVETLPALLSDMDQRRGMVDGLRRLCERLSVDNPEVWDRFNRVERTLGLVPA